MSISKGTQVPVNVVGSSTFGRYPKISLEKTYNMFISDEWLVNYPGYQKFTQILINGQGRGLFYSVRGQFLIAVVSSGVYKIQKNLAPQFIANIDTVSGEVFIDENLSSQICIVDGQSAYIYNYVNNILTQQTLTFSGNPIIPSYVCYHNTFFLIGSAVGSINSQNWYAFQFASDNAISLNTQFSLQTKPDSAIAVKRLPGRGNNVLVIGTTVCEVWTQVGNIENYRRVQSFNIDSGCVSVSTISANDEFLCFLAQNENNSPTILVTTGSTIEHISTDGIDFLLQSIQNPQQSTAFFFREDGHLFFQLTFFNPVDNLTLTYDFDTKKFFHISDENLNFHPARQVVYFNENTYFISLNDASIYQMGTQFVTYNYNTSPLILGDEIPRIRICKTIRKEDSSRFRVEEFTFWIEQGSSGNYILNPDNTQCNGELITETGGNPIVTEQGFNILSEAGMCGTNTICDGELITEVGANPIITELGFRILAQFGACVISVFDIPRVDMSFSKTGNQTFSNVVGKNLNPRGRYQNQIRWQRMGQCNEFTPQLRFWGFQRFVVKDGVLEIIQ
jgi:hypothetical protein